MVLSGKADTYRTTFSCESEAWKRRYIMEFAQPSESHCVFKDAADLSKLQAPCERHKKECAVPSDDEVMISIAGWSCKAP